MMVFLLLVVLLGASTIAWRAWWPVYQAEQARRRITCRVCERLEPNGVDAGLAPRSLWLCRTCADRVLGRRSSEAAVAARRQYDARREARLAALLGE